MGPLVASPHWKHAQGCGGPYEPRRDLTDSAITPDGHDHVVTLCCGLMRQFGSMARPLGKSHGDIPATLCQVRQHTPEVVFHIALPGHRISHK